MINNKSLSTNKGFNFMNKYKKELGILQLTKSSPDKELKNFIYLSPTMKHLEENKLDTLGRMEIIQSAKYIEEQQFSGMKLIFYHIAPHNQIDINETEEERLTQIKSLFSKFNIDPNYDVKDKFFTSFLCFSIFFRQEKISTYLIKNGANINYIDSLGLSPLNYLVARIVLGPGKEEDNMLNN